MTTRDAVQARQDEERFGRAVARRLETGAEELPHAVRERLRVARLQAIDRHQQLARQAEPVLHTGGGTAALPPRQGLGFWGRLASALPLVVLAGGLVLIHSVAAERRAAELAEVDAALLTDDLPPAAYADPGFVQFLRTHRE